MERANGFSDHWGILSKATSHKPKGSFINYMFSRITGLLPWNQNSIPGLDTRTLTGHISLINYDYQPEQWPIFLTNVSQMLHWKSTRVMIFPFCFILLHTLPSFCQWIPLSPISHKYSFFFFLSPESRSIGNIPFLPNMEQYAYKSV